MYPSHDHQPEGSRLKEANSREYVKEGIEEVSGADCRNKIKGLKKKAGRRRRRKEEEKEKEKEKEK